VLIAIMGILVLIRHYFNLRGVGQATNSLIGLIILAIIVLVFALSPSQNKSEIQEMVSISEVKSIIDRRCTSCHSDNPTDDVFCCRSEWLYVEYRRADYCQQEYNLSTHSGN